MHTFPVVGVAAISCPAHLDSASRGSFLDRSADNRTISLQLEDNRTISVTPYCRNLRLKHEKEGVWKIKYIYIAGLV